MARIYLRGRVYWTWGRYRDGSRWQESTGKRDKGAARLVAIQLERDRALLHGPEDAAGLTLTQAIDDVIAARRREGKTESTVEVYVRAANHLCRIFGASIDVHHLTLADLERYIDVRTLEGIARITIKLELGKLRSALLHAARHGRYRGVVAALWPAAALRNAYRPRERFLTHAEYVRLHADVETFGRGDWLAGYVYTGASRRELQRIHAEDVDLATGTLRIRGTKTGHRDRVVPIAPPLRDVVERRLAACEGGPLWPEWGAVSATLNSCARRLKMPPVTTNDLRRTFASWLAQAGVPELATARMMGHGSSKMVRTVYARFGVSDLHTAVAKMPGAVAPKLTVIEGGRKNRTTPPCVPSGRNP